MCVAAQVGVVHADTPAPAVQPADQLQIVESVPTGTDYGAAGVARTPAVWQAMIAGAKQRIDIAAFYVADKNGEALKPIMHALAERARAGVRIRILTGPTFGKETAASLAPLARLDHVTVRTLPVDALTGGVLHAKYFVVDGRETFIGSANWDWRAMDQIHEIGTRIRSPRLARTVARVFDFDWRLAADGDLPAARKRAATPPDFTPVTMAAPIRLNDGGTAFVAFSPPALVPDWATPETDALTHLIGSARHDLRIQVMTFSAINEYTPAGYWSSLDSAIRNAAARGVNVHIIVADWALREPMQAYLKSLTVLPNMTVKYSHVPEAARGFIPYARVEHAKYAVADDDTVYVGTGNWTKSYFTASLDVGVFAHDHSAARTLAAIFTHDWHSKYVTTLQPGQHYDPPRTH
ncbi:phospholipase D-like domain-containing protein [Salinisphaera sp. Q1T1-3]|uniref:phospholipase D-like domain-containing protein n=1 Tax=Salinisphaera sp. Q1T1-3 TaxID=2321229 RepID=UPI001F47806E|nr:phospholipase D-like domain-containing protein [Salinisphaera sp. Q1T1-3]